MASCDQNPLFSLVDSGGHSAGNSTNCQPETRIMKLTTPEIVWHSKEPVFSADFHRRGPDWRIATGGADNDIKIWKVLADEESGKLAKIEFVASLSRHTKAVNVVRFSPCGEYLASSGDDSVVCVWRLDLRSEGVSGETSSEGNLKEENDGKENWTVVKMMRGHLEDVYDLCWSPDSTHLISGSVDTTAIIWDVQKAQLTHTLKESHQYVQGVAWDPLDKYVAAISCDRHLRIYSTENHKFKCVHAVNKMSVSDQAGGNKQVRMWLDESLNSFFRRLAFSPDGSLLIVPSGRSEVGDKTKNSTYIFTRHNLTKPVLQLPGPEKPTVCIRCCPVLFELLPETNGTTPLTSLPYRMVFAVASLDSILLYDTQHTVPFAFVSNIHYAGITDMTWSNNGRILFVTSFDCYCSVITFSEGELGIQLADSKKPPHLLTESKVKDPPVDLKELVKDGHSEKKISNLELKGTPSTPSPSKADSVQNPPQPSGKTPRRIRPTQLESYTSPRKEDAKTPPLSSPIAPPTSHSTASTSAHCCAPCNVSASVPAAAVSASLPTTTTANLSDRGKNEGPRRVAFITLAKFDDESQAPPKCSKEQCDRTDNTCSKETGELMEVQTSE